MDVDLPLVGSDNDQLRLSKIFLPFGVRPASEAAAASQRFVYYTNADTVMSMIRYREVWMRKSSLMNDYREVEHGFDCLDASYKRNRDKRQIVLDGMFPGFCVRLEQRFNGLLPHFRTDTYITCVS